MAPRNLVLAVVALVAFAAAMVWILVEQPQAEPELGSQEVAAGEPLPQPAAAHPPGGGQSVQEPAQPAPRAATPAAQGEGAADFFAGQMPDFMADAHLRVLDKKKLGAPIQKQLYQWGQEHKDDARPQLLLAWDSMNREWDGYAVRLYRMAYRADPRAKQEPSMLRDLLDIASRHDRTEFRETVGIVGEAFGEEALPALDEKLAELKKANDSQGVARLQRLREKLTER